MVDRSRWESEIFEEMEKAAAAVSLHEDLLESLAADEGNASAAVPSSRSIELTRTSCFGECPVYRVALHADGRAEYDGFEYAPREGQFTGRIDVGTFAGLSRLIERPDVRSLEPTYAAPWTCDATTILRVRANAPVLGIEVRDYGRYGPVELQALRLVIDSVSSEIHWKPVMRGGEVRVGSQTSAIKRADGL